MKDLKNYPITENNPSDFYNGLSKVEYFCREIKKCEDLIEAGDNVSSRRQDLFYLKSALNEMILEDGLEEEYEVD